MHQQLIDFLNTDLQFIKGVGPVLAARLDAVLGGRRILDFLLHKPAYVRPRTMVDSIMNATPGELITIVVTIKSHKPGGKFRNGGMRPTQVIATDALGATLAIQFFGNSYLDYWLEKLPIGETRVISGKLEFNNYTGATINHPDFIERPENAARIPTIQAIYPSGEGLTQKTFANIRDQIFGQLPENLGEFFDALYDVHHPKTAEDLAPNSDAMMKLAYAELFAHQAAIILARKARNEKRETRNERNRKYNLLSKFYDNLPFALTGAQERVIQEIKTDMAKSLPMMRLVQGDVGSGKTIVALAAATIMAESGGQSVLMAPTDTLAQQHFAKLKPMCEKIGIVCDILTGRDKGAARREKLISLKSGRTKLAIGTHALFTDDVEYRDLGLVIIDEQHRFGVAQREAIRAKGTAVDLLALSATPIPRTLSMTIYGDMDVSIINEKPAGRMPIKTTKIHAARADELVARIRPQIENEAKVFWVCPLVEESETSDLMAAEKRYEKLRDCLTPLAGGVAQSAEGGEKNIINHPPTALRAEPPRKRGGTSAGQIGLVHGQMKKTERDKIMEKFSDPKSDMKILVSTTVIEVGIDVPSATIMVIENAERFGMAALHQLRGRVGRGATQSFCVLMYGDGIGADGMKRLDVLCETDDGFLIAEQDLMMRGTGELLGLKQSGWIDYKFVDYRAHRDLFKLASRDARDMQTSDEHTRDLLYIFNREVKVKA